MKKHCCAGNHLFLFVLHNNSADNHDNVFMATMAWCIDNNQNGNTYKITNCSLTIKDIYIHKYYHDEKNMKTDMT